MMIKWQMIIKWQNDNQMTKKKIKGENQLSITKVIMQWQNDDTMTTKCQFQNYNKITKW